MTWYVSGFPTRLAYGVGQAAEGIKVATLGGLLLFYYHQVLGLSPTATGFALFCGLLGDTAGGVVAGSISDRLRHHRGRRHPLMLAAVLPVCIALVALFWPPAIVSGIGLFFWLVLWLLICRVAMTFFTVPHFALGADMAVSSYAKTANVAFRQFFYILGGILVYWMARDLMVPTPDFPVAHINPAHYPELAFYCTAIALVSMLVTTIGTWHFAVPTMGAEVLPDTKDNSFVRVYKDFDRTLRVGSFRRLMVCVGAFAIAAGTNRTTEIYVATYFWGLPTSRAMLLPAATLLGSLAGVVFWTLLSRLVDKRNCYIGGIVTYGALAMALPVAFVLGLLPPVRSDTLAIIVLSGAALGGLLSAASPVFIGAMIADVIDADEAAGRQRRAASFFGTIAVVAKPALAVSALVSGALLATVGLESDTHDAQQVSMSLGLLSGGVVGLCSITAGLLMRRYNPSAQLEA
ncbi:MAG: MFS transporter [Gammaproteobacteria bacterium]